MIIAKIISGGQTGVDVAALRAARARGIPAGGTMPKGWKTLRGPKPEYRELYGMREAYSASYAMRTETNVRDADLTIRIAVDFSSAGELCTYRAILKCERPNFAIEVVSVDGSLLLLDFAAPADAARKIREVAAARGRPIVINFAGNSERTAPGIEAFAEGLVGELIEMVEAK